MSVTVRTSPDGEVTHSEATLAYPNEYGQLEVYSGDTPRKRDLVAVYAVNHWASVEITPPAASPA